METTHPARTIHSTLVSIKHLVGLQLTITAIARRTTTSSLCLRPPIVRASTATTTLCRHSSTMRAKLSTTMARRHLECQTMDSLFQDQTTDQRCPMEATSTWLATVIRTPLISTIARRKTATSHSKGSVVLAFLSLRLLLLCRPCPSIVARTTTSIWEPMSLNRRLRSARTTCSLSLA